MKKVLKWVFIIFLIILFIIIYARYIGTMGLNTFEYTLKEKNIPDSFDGLKVVHFSDIHYNRAIDIKKVNSVVDEINLINPDIVVFTGDLIDTETILTKDDYNDLAKVLRNIKSKYGKYAITGDNDYYKDNEAVLNIYESANFKYLDNDYDIIYSKDNESIMVGGLNTAVYQKDDLDKLFNDIDDDINYKIILIHEPDLADKVIKKDKVDLILAGHSIGGSIRLPLVGPVFKYEYAKKYSVGYYNLSGTKLYVSNGIGVGNMNYRLFNHPSINFYRINKKV